ncbi:SDR family NAD(P)-dependent oxidoreductase [Novosphingobium sp.]|uniref:SDR family NAD(P)-dependent oxidoreductase n=1 Tax=Novosphingobium sp. TaxID=1874826 RepID=UPI0025D58621|nr:SDR family NAD(P)-dependent oxidoreductase [Novosphingobium sp.]
MGHELSRSVEGLTVLVTGAASGMGRATAEVFAAAGAQVALTDLSGEAVETIAAQLRGSGHRVQGWALDVSDADAIRDCTASIADHFSGIDCLVNNAGISAFCPIDDDDHYDEVWERALVVLLTAHQRLVRAVLPHLRASSCPRIVNIASTEALGATSRDSPYCAAKAGVTGLTRALAVELGKEGITVNCICPGPIDTGMTANVPGADKATFAHRRTALRRYGLAEEVAHMTLSLCLPAASYVTGAVIPVDGGLMARNA